MLLDTTSKIIRWRLGEAHTTSAMAFVADYADTAAGATFVPASVDGASNGTTNVTAVAAPLVNVQRHIKALSFFNADTVPHIIIVEAFDGATARGLIRITVPVNGSLVWGDHFGWQDGVGPFVKLAGDTMTGSLLGTNVLESGYARIGSQSAPANTTAGDLTAIRANFGANAAMVYTTTALQVSYTSTYPSGILGIANWNVSAPAASGAIPVALLGQIAISGSQAPSQAQGLNFAAFNTGTWVGSTLIGANVAAGQRNTGTVTTAKALIATIYSDTGAGVVTTGTAFEANSGTLANGGTVGTMYGFRCLAQKSGSVTTAYGFAGDGTADINYMLGGIGLGTASPDRLLHAESSDAVTNAVTYAQRLTHITSGTAAANFGTGTEHELENASGTNRVAATFETIWTVATDAAESADYVVKAMKAGTLTEVARFNGAALTTIHAGPSRLKGYTVAGLPTGTEGDTAYVTDALTPTFGTAVVGGGAVRIPVFKNATQWVSF